MWKENPLRKRVSSAFSESKCDMPKLPRIQGREIIRALKRADFTVIRIRGSHHYLRHPDGRCTVVPVHAREAIGPGLLHDILKDAEMDLKTFIKFLK